MDRTKLSIVCLEHSYKNRPCVNEFSPEEFVSFAIENYFIRSCAIYERCLNFTGCLLDLGIANESINHVSIITNSHVVKYGLEDKLKKLRKVSTQYRIERNKIVHHEKYTEDSYNKFSAMHSVNKIYKDNGDPPLYKQELVDEITHRIIDTKVDEFQEHTGKITAALNDYYELAEQIYLKTKGKVARITVLVTTI